MHLNAAIMAALLFRMAFDRSKPLWLALVAAVIGAIVFTPSLGGEWIYDDHPLIEQNVYVHSLDAWQRWFLTDFWDVSAEAEAAARVLYWRPLVTASYAVDWQLGDGSPVMFHITNTLLHAGVAGLVFVLLHRWTRALWPAFAAALLYAVHPTKAESVAWISGRTDVLCTLFMLLAAQGMARRLRRQRGGIALEVIGTLGAYGCKEQAIVLPLLMAVEVFVHTGHPPLDRARLWAMTKAAAPQLLVAASYLVARTLLLPLGSSMAINNPDLLTHAQVVLETAGRFIALSVAPSDLSIQHGLVLHEGGKLVPSVPYIVLGGVATVGLIATAVLLRKRLPPLSVGIAFYLLALLPTSNIKLTSLSTLVSERFLYLPTLGLAYCVGALLAQISRAQARRLYPLLGACVLSLAALALSRATDFSSEREFWAREARLHPESLSAQKFQLKTELEERRFRDALDTLLRMQQQHKRFDVSSSELLAFAQHVALVVGKLVPDQETAELLKLDAFCRDLLERQVPVAELHVRGVRLTIPPPPPLPTHFGSLYSQLYALRAEFNSRLGNDRAALELATNARRTCPDCATFLIMDALTRARAGSYEEALAMLDTLVSTSSDPRIADTKRRIETAQAALRAGLVAADAEAYAALELWGRAFAAAEAHRTELLATPASRARFAELAFRAGDARTAREVLASIMSPVEIEDSIREWTRAMGWDE